MCVCACTRTGGGEGMPGKGRGGVSGRGGRGGWFARDPTKVKLNFRVLQTRQYNKDCQPKTLIFFSKHYFPLSGNSPLREMISDGGSPTSPAGEWHEDRGRVNVARGKSLPPTEATGIGSPRVNPSHNIYIFFLFFFGCRCIYRVLRKSREKNAGRNSR